MPRNESKHSDQKQDQQSYEQNVYQSRRFEEACEMMKQNAAKFLKADFDVENSSSEDELDDSVIIKKTLSQYRETVDNLSLRKTREFLQDILTSGAVACLICIESVRRNDMIWSCYSCFCMLHLHCIQKWAKDSLHLKPSVEDKEHRLNWCCPKCRCEYSPYDEPKKYLCFCGKVENPVFDVWTVPHSCGKTCEKNLKPNCGHTCTLLCHPGPCPPCPQTVLISCCCSKSKTVLRRCSDKEWSCGKICGKLLPCKLHTCEEVCHEGSCPSCKNQSEQKCLCGAESKLRPCESPQWTCKKVCEKPLECGHHTCEITCHEGSCPSCPNSGPRSCPCKKKIMYLPCTENVVPCGDTCNKLLECELHRCSQRCHFGSCETCFQMRVMKCRCGQREKSVPCCKEFICDAKCKCRRDCGRHFCNKKCCTGDCPPCEAPCGRTLNCGNHKCTSVCHSGPCYPCRETVSITCNCGLTKMSVPCGRKKSAVPPRCSANCKLPADCHHPQRHKHKCHFGSCPPCRLTCGKILECNHTCPAKCHSAVLTKIEIKQKKEGPWDLLNAYKMDFISKPCPPCLVPVPVICLGGHEVQNLACYEAQPRSCGRPCGRKLSCGNHTCSLECHDVSSAADLTGRSNECEECNETCKKARKVGCSHPCTRPCHPGDCSPCQQLIKIKCHCEINILYINCFEWLEADESKRDELMSCSSRCPRQMSCGHRCYLSCHKGPCGDMANCKKKMIIRCSCKRKKKEIQCFTQLKNTLSCDEECLELLEVLRMKEEEQEKKHKAEEKKKMEEEFQEFLRKTGGKKKKKRKHLENHSNNKQLKIGTIIISATVVCLIGLFLLYWIHVNL